MIKIDSIVPLVKEYGNTSGAYNRWEHNQDNIDCIVVNVNEDYTDSVKIIVLK